MGLRRPTGRWAISGGDLALRQNKGMEEVHAYRIAARQPAGAARPVATLIHEPELERVIDPCCRHALRPARCPGLAQHHGGSLRQNRLPRVPC